MRELSIRRPDDWHVHLRDAAGLASAAKFTAERFGRAIVMPNLRPPIVSGRPRPTGGGSWTRCPRDAGSSRS
jgi:dihydroorotase